MQENSFFRPVKRGVKRGSRKGNKQPSQPNAQNKKKKAAVRQRKEWRGGSTPGDRMISRVARKGVRLDHQGANQSQRERLKKVWRRVDRRRGKEEAKTFGKQEEDELYQS